MKGIVVKAYKSVFSVYDNDLTYNCTSSGKLTFNKVEIKVGDYVEFENNLIISVYPRKNNFTRPDICNIDKAILVTSFKEPEINLYILDKLISIFTYFSIEVIIIFTKLDLIKEEEFINILNYYRRIGYCCYYNTEIEKIKQVISSGISVFTGASGVGKSTLLNRLDTTLNLKTDSISLALKRGKNTTRHIELYKFNDGFIADSPGFNTLDISLIEKENLSSTFVEFHNKCEYRNCYHEKEINCYVKNNPDIRKSRYLNYLKFLNEINDFKLKNRGGKK